MLLDSTSISFIFMLLSFEVKYSLLYFPDAEFLRCLIYVVVEPDQNVRIKRLKHLLTDTINCQQDPYLTGNLVSYGMFCITTSTSTNTLSHTNNITVCKVSNEKGAPLSSFYLSQRTVTPLNTLSTWFLINVTSPVRQDGARSNNQLYSYVCILFAFSLSMRSMFSAVHLGSKHDAALACIAGTYYN